MPRGFRADEQHKIRADLLASAARLMSSRSIRQISVAELTSAVGISKGAFYLFFESKEALFLTLIVEAEKHFQSTMLEMARTTEQAPAERLRRLLRSAFTMWRQNPFLGRLSQDDLAVLVRAVPQALDQANAERDVQFAAQLLELLTTDGTIAGCSAATLAGALRALFFVSLHADEIGADYPAALDLLVEGVVGQVLLA